MESESPAKDDMEKQVQIDQTTAEVKVIDLSLQKGNDCEHLLNNNMIMDDEVSMANRKDERTNKEPSHFSWTFHIESLRLFGQTAFLLMFVICGIITETSGLESIPAPEATEIFRIFGFNHVCNYIDHNPSKTVAGIMVPLYTTPMMLYVFLYHYRLKARSKTHGDIPSWLIRFSQITLPYNIATFALLHMWFVNSPEGDYGFIPHYIPYLMFQVALSLILFMNVQYIISANNLIGFVKNRPWVVWTYQYFSLSLTIISICGVITLLAGYPIFDSVNNMTEQIIFRIISYVYGLNIVVAPIVFSAIQRLNGDENVITYACC